MLAKKLSDYRNKLQYTTNEVFIATGISTDRLISFETGLNEPTGDEILILADFYREDYKFFISNQIISASNNTESLYRQFGGEFSKDDRRAIQDFLYLCECEQDCWDMLGETKKLYSPKYISNSNKLAEETAKDVRLLLGYNENELIRNIFEDFRKLGVHIFRRKLNNSNISGVFIQHPLAGKCILVNYSEDLYRQNFTIAHEIAHSIFDTDKSFNVSFTKDGKDIKEIRANAFAANFLMPAKILKELNVFQWSPEILIRLSEQYKVNVISLLYRLKNLGIINETQLGNLKSSRLNSSTKIDPELANLPIKIVAGKRTVLELGLSSNYVRKCYDAYFERLISQSRLAEMLLTNEFDLQRLLDLFNLKLIYEF